MKSGGSAKPPLRILHVLSTLGRGGAETALLENFRNMDSDSIQFDFLVHGDESGDLEPDITALGGRIFRLPRPHLRSLTSYSRQLDSFLSSRHEYDAIHIHYYTRSFLYLRIAKQYGITVICHAHSDVPGIRGAFIEMVNLGVRKQADFKIACSAQAGAHLFGRRAVEAGTVRVLRNPIDVDRLAYDSRARLSVRRVLNVGQRPVLGHVGRFSPEKNHLFLVRAFNEILVRRPDAILLLVGDGPLRRRVEAEVAKLRIQDSVIFAGERRDVHHLLQGMDAFALPSRFEGFGIVALEAQASGLPTIVSTGVPPEVHASSLCRPLSLSQGPRAWAETIEQMFDTERTVAAASCIRAAGFDGRDCAIALRALYQQVPIRRT